MGRKKDAICRQHFTFNPATGRMKCNIGECSISVKTDHSGNLTRHLSRCHALEHEDVLKKRKEQKEQDGPSGKRIKIEMDHDTLLSACVELVTTNGRPFAILEDSGFKKIVRPILDALPETPAIVINSENIRPHVSTTATARREKIKNEIKGRFICLKIDCCTRLKGPSSESTPSLLKTEK